MTRQTPMMRQYSRIKERHRDSILLFRMGDFYEMFYEDALTASRVLGLTLTSRDRDSEGRVPLAGIPWHSAERYISRLIENGYSVAVCDQTEAPDRRKKLVAREVVEVITPGTVLSDGLLEAGRNNYLVAVAGDGPYGIAVADVSTGEFSAGVLKPSELEAELERLSPAELVVPAGSELERVLGDWRGRRPGPKVTAREAWQFSLHAALTNLTSHFGTTSLEQFGFAGDEVSVAAAGALMGYLKELKGAGLKHIFKLTSYRQSEFLSMDDTTIRNLELVRSLRTGGEEGSLLQTIRRTETAGGARFLRSAILRPLTDADGICARQEATDELCGDVRLRERLGEALRGMPDAERLMSRIANRKGGPRELVALGQALKRIPEARAVLEEAKSGLLAGLAGAIGDTRGLAEVIQRAVVDDAPVLMRAPGFIRSGFSEELDTLRESSQAARDWIRCLQASERERTGIASLRVGFNKVFGYYIEVTKPNMERVPPDYIRKQTLVNAERFITAELKEKESIVLGGQERELATELRILSELQDRVTAESRTILEAAAALASADFQLSLARVAMERKYVRPVVGHGTALLLSESRHPVVEAMLEDETFVPNDLDVDCDERQIMIITGPNMAGKSTFTRQVALIVIMAQAGSFVPAASAEVGVVDRIFCRLGASDDIARGRSTFLAEMSETASILNNCTRRSLVVMDEIGRGTSTFDGMSIAWAVLEHLHELGPRTLFATHYHELTSLASQLARVRNLNVLVKEWGDRIVFVHKVVEGASDRSYGIQVARLAGLPESVVARAREVLLAIQSDGAPGPVLPTGQGGSGQLDLFGDRLSRLMGELAGIDTDQMTPLEALRTLARLRTRYLGSGEDPEVDGVAGPTEEEERDA